MECGRETQWSYRFSSRRVTLQKTRDLHPRLEGIWKKASTPCEEAKGNRKGRVYSSAN